MARTAITDIELSALFAQMEAAANLRAATAAARRSPLATALREFASPTTRPAATPRSPRPTRTAAPTADALNAAIRGFTQ